MGLSFVVVVSSTQLNPYSSLFNWAHMEVLLGTSKTKKDFQGNQKDVKDSRGRKGKQTRKGL